MYYGSFSLENLKNALQVAPRPVFNSFFLATTASLIGMVFGMAISYLIVRKRGMAGYVLDLAMMLPLFLLNRFFGKGTVPVGAA
jgi:iron(III) transport system permease protein